MDFIEDLPLGISAALEPWEVPASLPDALRILISHLASNFIIKDDIAIEKSAIIEEGVILKGPLIIGAGSRIGAHAYLRGGVYIGSFVTIGPGCEIKSSIIMDDSSAAHFNYIGDSLIGSHVNLEAGAIIANHYNEREDKDIYVRYADRTFNTFSKKFGALVGDHSKIGANAVLSPGTILPRHSIVKRLELVEQVSL
jgi:NDP-sugar pyrophosphorylase family protein